MLPHDSFCLLQGELLVDLVNQAFSFDSKTLVQNQPVTLDELSAEVDYRFSIKTPYCHKPDLDAILADYQQNLQNVHLLITHQCTQSPKTIDNHGLRAMIADC